MLLSGSSLTHWYCMIMLIHFVSHPYFCSFVWLSIFFLSHGHYKMAGKVSKIKLEVLVKWLRRHSLSFIRILMFLHWPNNVCSVWRSKETAQCMMFSKDWGTSLIRRYRCRYAGWWVGVYFPQTGSIEAKGWRLVCQHGNGMIYFVCFSMLVLHMHLETSK